MTSKTYKCCVVPECLNTSIQTPDKLFIQVPRNLPMRRKWLLLTKRDTKGLTRDVNLYVCEDHFDLPNDMVNYMQYHIMGCIAKIKLKRGCVPSKFECLRNKRKSTFNSIKQPHILKKQKMMTDEECSNNTVESMQPLEDTSEASSVVKEEYLEINEIDYCNQTECEEQIQCETKKSTDTDKLWMHSDNGKTESNTGNDSGRESGDLGNQSMYGDDGTAESISNLDNGTLQEGLLCHICDGKIVGYRYTCVQCADYDLCGACEASGAHPHHYALRVPGARAQIEIQAILKRIRTEINLFELSSMAPPCNEDEISVKTESQDGVQDSVDSVTSNFIYNPTTEDMAPLVDTDPLSLGHTRTEESLHAPLISPKKEPFTTDNISCDEVLENLNITQRPSEEMPDNRPVTSTLPEDILKVILTPPTPSVSPESRKTLDEEPELAIQNRRSFIPRIIKRSKYLKKPGKTKTFVIESSI